MSAALTLPAERATVALKATYEVYALVDMLKREQATNQDTDNFGLVLRSTLARIHSLNYVAMSVLGQDSTTTEELQKVVHGEAAG